MNTPGSTPIGIALIDNNTGYRQLFANEINTWKGYRVVLQANDGAAFLSQLDIITEIPDVCILDISMPHMNGYQTMSLINKKWPFLKVIILTMFESELAVMEMLSKKARAYITKKSTPEELKTAIDDVYYTGYHHSAIASTDSFAKARNWQPILSKIPGREMEFLLLCRQDLNYHEIALKMNISISTVETYRDNLFRRFMVRSRSALVMSAMQCGLITTTGLLCTS